jgi:hypothetical protein
MSSYKGVFDHGRVVKTVEVAAHDDGVVLNTIVELRGHPSSQHGIFLHEAEAWKFVRAVLAALRRPPREADSAKVMSPEEVQEWRRAIASRDREALYQAFKERSVELRAHACERDLPEEDS